MGIEVFNRYEKKFMIDDITFKEIQKRFEQHMEMDEFNKVNGMYTVSNIYYDTVDNELIHRSLSKPIYKEKLRLRAYGVPEQHMKGYLEIKKKYKGLVNKRRTSMVIADAYHFMETGRKPEEKSYHNKQVINEIEFFLRRYKLQPAIYIAYDRIAFFSKKSKDLRITFDSNIRTRRYDLSLEAGDHGEQLIGSDLILMEIKAENAFPLWLSRMLSEMEVYPISFSKYGQEFMAMNTIDHINELENLYEQGDNQLCLNQYFQQQQPQPLYL